MGRFNAAKANQKRERNAKKMHEPAGSQLKANQAAQNVICQKCRQPFICTVQRGELEQHLVSKHDGKATLQECFPGWSD